MLGAKLLPVEAGKIAFCEKKYPVGDRRKLKNRFWLLWEVLSAFAQYALYSRTSTSRVR